MICEQISAGTVILVRVVCGTKRSEAIEEMTDLAVLTGKKVEAEFNNSPITVRPI